MGGTTMEKLFEQEGCDLMAAAFEVYNEKGNGYLEDVYQECLEIELELRGVRFEREPQVHLTCKGRTIRKTYRPDLLAFGEIIVELKAVKELSNDDYAQLLNYLKSTGKRVGYLINFGSSGRLEWKRFVLQLLVTH
jgi:GxxExxY protein